jgi:hypothetical protein
VASLDSTIGEIGSGDVLIDGAVIAEVGRNINAPDAEVVDARVGWRVRVRCYFRGEPYNAGHCTGRSCATPLPNFGANTVRSTR